MRISIYSPKQTRNWAVTAMALALFHAAYAQPSDGAASGASTGTADARPSPLGGVISSATTGIESALSNLLRSAPIALPGSERGSAEPPPVAAPVARPPAANTTAREYEAALAKARANEKARENRALVPITPDMCLDGLCVEQDLGEVAVNLNWAPPEPPGPMTASDRRSLEAGMQKCTQANQSQWGDRAAQLCDFLILGALRPKSDLVAFFKKNRQAVCMTGGKYFKMEVKTDLGQTYVQVFFARDGRPRIKELAKDFYIKSKDDVAEWLRQLNKKHPYLDDSAMGTAPWGGYVKYFAETVVMRQRYELGARSVLFDRANEPSEGECTPARKTISVQ